jgi:hypothetical protein
MAGASSSPSAPLLSSELDFLDGGTTTVIDSSPFLPLTAFLEVAESFMSTSSWPLAPPLGCLSPLISSCCDSDLEFAFDLVVRDELDCSFLEPDEADLDLSSAALPVGLFDRRLRRSVGMFSVQSDRLQLKQVTA